MADVPLTIAVISTVSPVVAGAIPVILGWIRDSRRDTREQEERVAAERMRLEQEKRGECVKLLGLARDFRVLVEDTCDPGPSDLVVNIRQIRKSAADLTGLADEVGLMVFSIESPASSLADEARILADTVADAKNRALGASLLSPDFTRFERCLAEFKAAVRVAFGYPAPVTAESADNVGAAERLGLQAAGEGQESLGLGAS